MNCIQRKRCIISSLNCFYAGFVYAQYTRAPLPASMTCGLKARGLFAPWVHPVCEAPQKFLKDFPPERVVTIEGRSLPWCVVCKEIDGTKIFVRSGTRIGNYTVEADQLNSLLDGMRAAFGTGIAVKSNTECSRPVLRLIHFLFIAVSRAFLPQRTHL